jgi:hypothetical protein
VKYRNFAVACLLTTFSAAIALSQNVSFTRKITTNAPYIFATADLNNDGREDLIGSCSAGNTGNLGVTLSNGSGTYAPQTCYATQSVFRGGITVGDFNGDGYLDVIALSSANPNSFDEYLNKGDGTLRLQATFVTKTSSLLSIVAGDFNHDGHIDLAFVGYNDPNLYVYFGNGDGGFNVGPTSAIQIAGDLSVGDFDGDGNADILSQFNTYTNSIQVDYGDGHGHFAPTPGIGDDVYYQPYDLNSDGKMDLVGAPFDFSLNGSTYYKEVRVMYGNSNRTFTTQNIPLNQCTAGGGFVAVADFNGDGVKDLAVNEASDCQGTGPYTIDILPGNGDGTYGAEQPVYSSNYSGDLYVFRGNQDTKPDIRFYGYLASNNNTEDAIFLNTSSGSGFPSCAAPNRAVGIALCSPTSEVAVSSPVTFSIGAANQTPGRKVEVWIDGHKQGESLAGWSYDSFLNADYNVANGSHTVTIYSAGWDNLLQKVTFPLTVGSTGCAPPPSPGVNVCSPLPGARIGKSVLAWASGTVTGTIARMEVWVDGVKDYSTPGSDTLKTNLSLASGTHTFTYYIVNTAGQKWQTTVVATVK